ncbi:hypothetical protein Pan189_38820 [Stratiformator vulcanicus]|uniref:Uncharacterized protein n=1 Tax=Stratiformator vulcanicus TaxID=2527980 RepID=A0A517R6F3_9PLAN|nr:hypothetical protein Pan189_38820 [Stratiformator vulcanicus]
MLAMRKVLTIFVHRSKDQVQSVIVNGGNGAVKSPFLPEDNLACQNSEVLV